MSGLIDSEAQFGDRISKLGFSDDLVRAFKRAKIRTIGNYAFTYGQPNQPINDDEFESWLTKSILASASIADVAAAKRLLFECHLLVMQDIKDQINRPEATASRKIPAAERESKMAALKKNLGGLVIEGPLEPGHSLLDACAAMVATNEIRYIPPERCVARSHEILHYKTPTKQLELASDNLVIKEQQQVPDMTATSALQVQEALVRRGLAMTFADMVTYQDYSRYITMLFSHLHREPPAGYSRCSVSQLIAADKAVFQRLLEQDIKPKRSPDGECALDAELMKALESYQVSFTLLPLAAKKESQPIGKKTKPTGQGKGAFNVQQPIWNKKGGKKGAKGKQRVPPTIYKMGGSANDADGRPICFAYNSEAGCSESVAEGARCSRGFHVCAKCFKVHSILQHATSS